MTKKIEVEMNLFIDDRKFSLGFCSINEDIVVDKIEKGIDALKRSIFHRLVEEKVFTYDEIVKSGKKFVCICGKVGCNGLKCRENLKKLPGLQWI